MERWKDGKKAKHTHTEFIPFNARSLASIFPDRLPTSLTLLPYSISFSFFLSLFVFLLFLRFLTVQVRVCLSASQLFPNDFIFFSVVGFRCSFIFHIAVDTQQLPAPPWYLNPSCPRPHWLARGWLSLRLSMSVLLLSIVTAVE